MIGNSVVPGLPNRWVMPSSLSSARKAERPVIRFFIFPPCPQARWPVGRRIMTELASRTIKGPLMAALHTIHFSNPGGEAAQRIAARRAERNATTERGIRFSLDSTRKICNQLVTHYVTDTGKDRRVSRHRRSDPAGDPGSAACGTGKCRHARGRL